MEDLLVKVFDLINKKFLKKINTLECLIIKNKREIGLSFVLLS